MPRSEEANIQIKDERQQRILSSALKVFIRKGFAATKISDIALEAGMSNGLMYHYFQSKEEIYAELVRRAATFSRRLLEQVQADGSEPMDQLRSLAVRIFQTVEKQQAGGHYFVLILEAMTSGVYPAQAIECQHGSGRPFEALVGIIAEGQRRGQIVEGDPGQLAITFFSAIVGLALLKVSGTIRSMPDPELLMRIFRTVPSAIAS
ncbi:MAG TPA: TetR/AcrR family transcriptional regulator [Candidatus Cryosericum sp.]|nr:TetR/AcrR family transcriptional regulator [Candidatus Cryosericum sp.]